APTGRIVLSASADPRSSPSDTLTARTRLVAPAALLEAIRLARKVIGAAYSGAGGAESNPQVGDDSLDSELEDALDRAQAWVNEASTGDTELARSSQVISLTIALIRGLVADEVLTDPQRLTALDDEDYRDWIRRHGAASEAVDGGFLQALYDMVVGYEEGNPERPRFSAGTALLLAMKFALEYKGAIFWKMRAGMGDVVFAPLYEALRRRGVDFEFFHRVDRLHLSADRTAVDAITIGRQARLARGVDRYEPLVSMRGLPCFPQTPAGPAAGWWGRHGGPAGGVPLVLLAGRRVPCASGGHRLRHRGAGSPTADDRYRLP